MSPHTKMSVAKYYFGISMMVLLSNATPTPDIYSIENVKRQASNAPPYTCSEVVQGYQICLPETGNPVIQRGNNIFGGITTELSQEEYPGNTGSNRYNVITTDVDEIVYREDLEISPYGTNGTNQRVAKGSSIAQTWTITVGAGIQPEGIGSTLSFSYAETYTVTEDLALSCTVDDPVGVFVVSPAVNHRGGWVYQTDNIAYWDNILPDQVVTKVFRWDTDIPLNEVGGFIQGIYGCCGGAQVPFPCCTGNCQHVGGQRP